MSTFARQPYAPPFREEIERIPLEQVQTALLNGWQVVCDSGDGTDAVLMRPPQAAAERAA